MCSKPEISNEKQGTARVSFLSNSFSYNFSIYLQNDKSEPQFLDKRVVNIYAPN